jgi:hypothetical protein
MFGYAAYAQPAYAALGGVYFVVTLTENIAVVDTEAALRTQFASILESIISETDAEAVVATFVTFITEAMQAADINIGNAYYPNITISEGITAADINNIAATFRYAVSENIDFRDAPIGFAWVKIDNTEGTQWVLIDNRQ